MMRKRRKAWGEEFRFWSYMPPFFFDFFFLAFVGLFTRLHTHNGVCLRILLFFRRHDISWQKFPIGQVHCVTYRLLIDFSSSRHFASRTVSLNLLWENRLRHLPVPSRFCTLTRSNSLGLPVFVAVCKKLVTSADWFQRCSLSSLKPNILRVCRPSQ